MLGSETPHRIKAADELFINSYLLVKEKPLPKPAIVENIRTTLAETRQETSQESSIEYTVEEEEISKVPKNAATNLVQVPADIQKPQDPNMLKSDNHPPRELLSTSGLPTDIIELLQKEAFETMLKQETDSFNKLKSSPIIDTIGTLDTTKRPTERQPNIVYCDGTASKTIVALSSITGGNVQCKALEIQSFIDKRLTKYAEQP
jgi:hypothetical protein